MARPAWLVVARREFLVRVRTIWFIVVTVLGPVGMIGLILVPAYLAKKSIDDGIKIQCVDHTPDEVCGKFATDGKRFRIEIIDPDTPEEVLEKRIRDEEIDGYLILPEDLLGGASAIYRGANTSNMPLMRILKEELLQRAVVLTRARKAGLTDLQILSFTLEVDLSTELTTGTGEVRKGSTAFLIGYATMFLLYMSILLYAVNVMRSVIEEKTSRVVEIIVSTIRPRSLMIGKILGVGSVGLLQLASWLIMALLIFQYRGFLLGWFGMSAEGLSFPTIAPGVVVITLLYFLLGFFFYAALYAAIGAMVNSEQEAQQLQMPVVMLLIIPVVCTQFVANDPLGGAAEVLTLIPFSSPVLMPMRYVLGGASLTEVIVSLGVLMVSLAGVVWLAARIYRVGILMYGKRPSFRETWRWIRY